VALPGARCRGQESEVRASETDARLKVYGVADGELVEPMYVTRVQGSVPTTTCGTSRRRSSFASPSRSSRPEAEDARGEVPLPGVREDSDDERAVVVRITAVRERVLVDVGVREVLGVEAHLRAVEFRFGDPLGDALRA